MSTQQQIDQYNAIIRDKQADLAAQESILRVQEEEVAKAEQARIDAQLALQRAQNSNAPPEQIEQAKRQLRQAEATETSTNVAAGKTEDNISRLQGSIRFNTTQRDLYQGSLPAQGVPASTGGDRQANARTNAAETAPAPQPIAASTPAVPPSQRGDQGGFVTNAQGELIPSDSAEADEIRAEQNRVRTAAPPPVIRSAIEEGGEAEAQAALATRNARPEPVPANLTAAWDPETGSWGVFNNDTGVFETTGLTEQEANQDAGDPFEAARLAREAEFSEEQPSVFGPAAPPPNLEVIWDSDSNSWGIWDADTGTFTQTGFTTEEEARRSIASAAPDVDLPIPPDDGLTDEERDARDQAALQAAAKEAAINQATRSSVYKKEGSSDWRLRLQLAPTSTYLYNANPAGILQPLAATNGVIFPYTPQINTAYKANYEQYDLVHSNYRGVYYKNSRLDDVSIRGIFTAQDTREADYLLAVIHFFRSVTKMFYGKDTERGTPPPLVFLSGFGMNQFYGHPCVVSNFTYNLPDNVDYIRATNYNNYGTDLLSRRTPSKSSGIAGLGPSGNRILNAGLERFFPAAKPTPDSVTATVNNTQLANYVPTKMEIDITLIPVQTRSQVSKQFSLKGFANGDLIKGGFW
jgi:hypothetical protein